MALALDPAVVAITAAAEPARAIKAVVKATKLAITAATAVHRATRPARNPTVVVKVTKAAIMVEHKPISEAITKRV